VGEIYGTNRRGDRCLPGLGWEAEGKRPLGRPRIRWEDNIKPVLREIEIHEANWIQGLSWLRIGSNGGLLCTR
jgi:hypothetical protein